MSDNIPFFGGRMSRGDYGYGRWNFDSLDEEPFDGVTLPPIDYSDIAYDQW